MSLHALVENQTRKAFLLARDLAVDATFVKKTATGFNFGTAAVTAGNDGTAVAKVIITETEKEGSKITKTFLVKSSDIGALGHYAEVVIQGLTWKMGSPLKDSGFILMTQVYREE
jgi:hypothetical protein